MIRNLIVILLTGLTIASGQEKDLTLEDIFKDQTFPHVSMGNWKWIPESDAYAFFQTDTATGEQSLYRVDLESGDTLLFISVEAFKVQDEPLKIENFWFSDDGRNLLLQTSLRRIWRRSREGTYYVYSRDFKKLVPVTKDNSRLRNVKLSPDGNQIAFVRPDNNLYVFDVKRRQERRLTRDGSEDILNGHFGWVYEEEFGTYDGYRWSPDSKQIAFWREDQSQVATFRIIDEMGLYPEVTGIRYPKVGEVNPTMKIGVVNVRSGRVKWQDIGNNSDVYYPRIKWTVPPLDIGTAPRSESSLVIYRMNRHQNRLELLKSSTRTGKSTVLLVDSNATWVDINDDLHFLDESTFVWTSERSGFKHIYRYDLQGNLLNQITAGNWEVSRIVDVDDSTGTIYFSGKKESVIESHIYSVKKDGSEFRKLTEKGGWHSPRFSPTRSLFIDFHSTVGSPTTISLHDSSGMLLRVIKEADLTMYQDYGITDPEFVKVRTADDGTELNAMITFPRDFDSRKKYPVIIYGYAGPGSQTVVNRWGGSRFLWQQFMSQHGYILFSIDNRGTGGQGKDFKALAYGDIGKWAVFDHIEGAKYLAALPYVDKDRIGIWGWSGGGYLTSMCMTKGAGNFKVGIAVAPVTDFRLYDTIWTERYMGLLAENEAGYDSASVMTWLDRYQGKLLLIHGTGDDNVHSQNSLQLIDKAVELDKYIDLAYYPNRNHGIHGGNTSFHLFTRMTRYFLENL